MQKLITCKEIAARYGVKITTVWEWIRKGRLAAVKVGHQYRVYEHELTRFERPNGGEMARSSDDRAAVSE